MRRIHRLVAAALLPLAGGCFSYAPLAQPNPPRASALRLTLSTPGDYRLANVTMNDVGLIEGELVAMDDSVVIVSATRLVARSGFEHLGEGTTLRVPRASIGAMQIKRLSPLRTALFSGALVAGASLIGAAAGGALGGGAGSGSGGKTQ